MKKRVYNSSEGYDLHAPDYDNSLKYLDSFEKDSFLKLISNIKGQSVLDLGCGTGRVIGELKREGAKIKAVDISGGILKVAQKKFPDVEFVLADAADLPFESESFDLVVSLFLIVHIKKLSSVFDEIYRVLKPGGRLILSNINQRKAPKLKLKDGGQFVITSFYHMPKHVIAALEASCFTIMRDEFVYEGTTWVNQIIVASK